MKRIVILLCAVLILLMTACGEDYRGYADGQAIVMKAQQDAADQQALREQTAAKETLKLEEQYAMSGQWVSSWNTFVRWTMMVMTLAAAILIMATSTGASWAVIGIGRATAFGAAMRARQIPMDKDTGSYPLLAYEGKGWVTMTDMNTGLTLRLDTRNEADRQLIAGSMALRLGGVVSRNARLAGKNASGVAMVGTHPVVIGARIDKLQVGEYLMEEEGNAN